MNVTDEQFQELLAAAGSRSGPVLNAAKRMGLVETPAPPVVEEQEQPARRTTADSIAREGYEPESNVVVEGADADTEEDDDAQT